MVIDDILQDLEEGFDKCLSALARDLNKIRTGRANLAMLDDIRLDYYGSLTPLNQVATLTVADPRMITIRPWEKTMIPVIEKAINQAGLGINPSNDGELVRLPIPPLSGERRKELVRHVRRFGEDARVAARNHRRDANDMCKELTKEGELSEDARDRALKNIQTATDSVCERIDEVVTAKEKEVMEV